MIKTVNFYDFCDAFNGTRKDNFSFEGKQALFDYLEEYEESTGEKIELDTIALCCEYTEYESIEAVKENYENIKDLEDLENYTQVIKIDDTDRLLIADF